VDYRLLSILALVMWGIWGFMSKVLMRSMTPATFVLWSSLSSLLPTAYYVVAFRGLRWERLGGLALLAGLFGGAATLFFYHALSRGPASVVVPLSGMYIVIPAMLGFIFLHEPVTISHVVGVACAGAAVFFLSR
jgi:transporter family protein